VVTDSPRTQVRKIEDVISHWFKHVTPTRNDSECFYPEEFLVRLASGDICERPSLVDSSGVRWNNCQTSDDIGLIEVLPVETFSADVPIPIWGDEPDI
jgi:hypothetical protein